jgi:hypothetical protein
MHNTNPINPATGLPMTTDDIGGVDVGGSTYGTNNADLGNYGPFDTGFGNPPWTPPMPSGGGFGGFDWP